jgi:DNA repair photolyase
VFGSLLGMSARERLRWAVTDERPAQPALFDDPPQREIGTGEFRGLEFLHVRARTIINDIGANAPMPFRYTINAYRGCSHACSYCLWGETPVLMADGRTKPIAEITPGDRVSGTRRLGPYRRYVATEVVDHWSTTKPAWRVELEDGTELIASGDHRFLTERGWRHVTDAEPGHASRPHLTSASKLMGTGQPAPRPDHPAGGGAATTLTLDPAAITTGVPLRVVSIEPLGIELPMFDITTGTGDFIANGVVSHNCFARPTHEYLNLNTGEDFERVIVVKVNAIEKLRVELAPKRWRGDHIAMGTNTDPYQRAEGKYRLTRGIIEELIEASNSFSILTKGTLILRDLDLLVAAAEQGLMRVNFSIGTLDGDVWRATEPGTPHPRKRVEALARLAEAGIPTGVLVAPVLPGLSDRRDQLDEVVGACVEAGAESITPVLLHLRPGVREHYLSSLAEHRPDLLARHHRLYQRPYAPKAERDRLTHLVGELVREHRAVTSPRSAS